MTQHHNKQRRQILQALASAGLLSAVYPLMPAMAKQSLMPLVPGRAEGNADIFDFNIARTPLEIGGQFSAQAITINGTIPAPLLKLKEGREAVLRVKNELDVDTSIHWHGILLPYQMDGVPGISFAGIKPGETFEYRFPVVQNGTYWYHSHSGMQEQLGHYGPLVIEPEQGDDISVDRDYVILLSDWTFDSPADVMRKLKVAEGYYNYNHRTVADFFDDVEKMGWQAAWQKSAMWGQMRMSPRDILDVTGSEYTYLINGKATAGNWTGLFNPGEKVRLRVINASAMTFFDLKIPGLEMTVVAADGQPVQPVKTDEFRIGVAETYDVIVEPVDEAYTLFAQSQDRSGFVSATLASRPGLTAPIPDLYPRVERGMEAMGAGHDMHGQMAMDSSEDDMQMDHGEHHAHQMAAEDTVETVSHGPDNHGPGAAMVVDRPTSRLDDPGVGFEHVDHRVLTYSQLKSHDGWPDKRPPAREIELHLTGSMERYMWSFDGKKFSEVDGPIRFYKDERLRLTLVNDTMMDHPIHLHGMWMELENGHGDLRPRKHTIIVKPGERVSSLITADAFGDWAFHCHLMYHMKAGMFRVVSVA
ncbi:MAG: copper resistance system multicopper oxidase [Pseudomonadota bacterium]|nr:copper resistance system multicopper oxidase [Pseudomonadota bacterium]